MNSPQLPVQMMHAAVRTDGTGLDSELPPDTAARLRDWQAANSAALQASVLTPERMQMFEPWFVGLMISMTERTKQGLDPKLGLDQHIHDIGQAACRGRVWKDGIITGDAGS